MKRIYLLLGFCIISLTTTTFAQGHFGGQKSIGLSYLGVDKGYGANLNYQQFIGSQYFGYRIDADYLSKKHNLTVLDYTFKTDLERYSLGSALVYSFEDLMFYPLYLQAYVGAMIGQEKINKGRKEIDTIPYSKPRTNLFGGYIGAELEVAFNRRSSLIINAKNTFSNSDIKKSMFTYNIGFKYILND
ncbi:hypothetical protein NWE55_16920 (plasmid) [Myroides albus]|uniref:Outer membrane protein beta-barrel domain-containing protein n=1 Tax=Myroides odoratimimus TaxID=76832 RepID=A0AAI8C9J1_9FLAO|nr:MULTISPECIES: hypothetical protein [Myroides]ALU28436.1 hypothetical protein AS202_19845 [Myroides odoratimimus]ALU28506.1 hypothetical protein AS202_20215 [Myroides odoratimimus]UVD81355.1 hypothetical protein NWE55_16920 [Myroides albus]